MTASSSSSLSCTRRAWLGQTAAALAAGPALRTAPHLTAWSAVRRGHMDGRVDPAVAARVAQHAVPLDGPAAEALVQRTLDAAKAAGATYADARLTRTIMHHYQFGWAGGLRADVQTLGIGVRALVNGYWGFGGSAVAEPDEAVRLAKEAVSVAKANAKGPPRTVELGRVPAVRGSWVMPVEIDPFHVSIEEKWDTMQDWDAWAARWGVSITTQKSFLRFVRQEWVTGTTDGTLVTQTTYETGGYIEVGRNNLNTNQQTLVSLRGLEVSGRGWEHVLAADVPEQLRHIDEALAAEQALAKMTRPATVGAYTLVCDGTTMAALVDHTLGLATQLDRAMGYEANAGGTSYLDDPLAMVGQEKVASPMVTLTADRSMEHGLATVRWDEEGVEPDTATLVKDGVLTDFQTTRESAAWLKEYYAKVGKPVRSHGHAAASSGLEVPLQQPPNFTLAPAAGAVRLEDLIGSVPDGLLIEQGEARSDFQGKNGVFFGNMRLIRKGRLGPRVVGGAVLFTSADLWKKVTAVGGPTTVLMRGESPYVDWGLTDLSYEVGWRQKGQPPQLSGHSTRAAAAVISNQALIDPARRA